MTRRSSTRRVAKGYVATHANGDPFIFTSNFSAPAALIDFTDPAAVRWWKGRIRAALKLGAEGFMQDFGEQTQIGMRFDDGSTGRTMHNRYSVLFHRATHGGGPRIRALPPGPEDLLLHPQRLLGDAGRRALRVRQLPRRRDDRLEPLGRARLADHRHAQPRDRRRLRLHDRHRRLLRHPLRADRARSCSSAGRNGRRSRRCSALHGSLAAGTHTPWSYDAATLRIYKRLAPPAPSAPNR